MYNATSIKAAFLGVNAWRQNINPNGWQLTAMTTGASGLYYNDYHPLLTFDNIQSVAPEFDQIYPSDGALRNTAFTAWLQQKTEASVMKVVTEWFEQKSGLKTATSLIARTDLFKSSGNLTDMQAALPTMSGIEIKPTRSHNLREQIEKFSLQLETNQTVRVYLFKSGVSTAQAFMDCTYAGAGSVQWFTPATLSSWVMKGEGVYYLCYDGSLITDQIVNGVKDYNYRSGGLTHFPGGKYFLATAFHRDGTAGETTLWDISGNTYTLDTNYGLNVSISSHCDYTDLITEQKDLFKTAMGLQVAIDMLSELLHNPQSNINNNMANVNRNDIYFDLYGDTQGSQEFSMSTRYRKSLNAISFDKTNIDELCLPCIKDGIEWSSVGPVGSPGIYPSFGY